MRRILLACLFACTFLIQSLPASAQQQPWNQWLAELKQEAVADGIDPDLFDRALDGIQPAKRVLSFDRRQPEKRLTFMKYRNTRADAFRIRLGRSEYKKNKDILEEVGKQYGVDPCFIVSFWGIESSYGRFLGSFPVIKSLATLAYDNRRGEFFRKELIYALHILQEGHVPPSKFKGEWAGASGHPQFLPSSWHKYAVDYNGDGHRDIWTTRSDVFASIANYLAKNGWRANQPWAIMVDVPAGFDESMQGKTIKKTVSEWRKLGVEPKQGFEFPSQNLEASIIEPYGGPHFMTFDNFAVIKRYNNSIYYAGTVGYMADSICRRNMQVAEKYR